MSQKLATNIKRKLLKHYSIPESFKTFSKVSTVEDAIEAKTESLAFLKKHSGEDFILAYIKAWVLNCSEYFNVGKSMTEQQIDETSQFILLEYYTLTIADIYLIFKKAKLGHFGQLYDRLDGGVILNWFERYFDERTKIFALKNIAESAEYKNELREASKKIDSIILNEDELKQLGTIKKSKDE